MINSQGKKFNPFFNDPDLSNEDIQSVNRVLFKLGEPFDFFNNRFSIEARIIYYKLLHCPYVDSYY